jgi:RNA polymerase sigma factor (sigma-70 family)
MAIKEAPAGEQLSDTELIERILSGEKQLFEVMIRRYNQRLFRIGMTILENDVEVEDAMQNSYINAYLNLGKFEHRSSFPTWLTRIMLNQCLAQKKKNERGRTVETTDNLIHMKTPANELVNKELNAVLENAIAGLPEKYRLVFVLREIEELSVKETSEALSLEESNVKVRLNRAKTMLKENLNGYMKDHVYSFHLTRCDRIVAGVLSHLGISC